MFLLASSTHNIHLAHYTNLLFLADALLVVWVYVRRDNADATDNISPTAFRQPQNNRVPFIPGVAR